MFLTLQYITEDEPRFITFEGSPKDCQTQANAFIGDGIYVNRIILIGEK
jgi:hypothetical protein